MYVCGACVKKYGLLVKPCAATCTGPCEMCATFSGDWKSYAFLVWESSLPRVFGDAGKLRVELALFLADYCA